MAVSTTTGTRGVAALLALGLLAGVAGPAAAAAEPSRTPAAVDAPAGEYIVRAVPGALDAVAERVAALGGTVTHRLALIDAVAADLSGAAVTALGTDPRVAAVTADADVRLQTTYDPATDQGSMASVAAVTGARSAWSKGATGRGVDVALIDSGVTRVPGLDTSGKVLNGPDLSFESQSDSTRYLDTFGHGTHMAGIIAGRDAGVTDPLKPPAGAFLGVAPDARVVSVKVADAYGATDVSQVIAGIDWVVQNKNSGGLNIRVLNLSFGTPATQSYLLDPLAHAAEAAWHRGIVVVVSAGNDGTGTGKLLNPAQDPYVLAVGAERHNGTQGLGDDVVPDFSTRGDGVRNPDVVAPGTSLQSLRVPGSWIDQQFPGGYLSERFFRGSGTSQAAAVVSGTAALLLSHRPALTPDQVKALLRGTAELLPAADAQAQGRGIVKVDRAMGVTPTTLTQSWPRSTGTGSLHASRGGTELVLDGVVLSGERDVHGQVFDSTAHASLAESATAWTDGTWNGRTWAGSSWAGDSWAGATWTGSGWSGRTWAGRTWAAGSWTGRTWAGQSWSDGAVAVDGTLTGRTWAGRTWGGRTWAGGGWSSGGWG